MNNSSNHRSGPEQTINNTTCWVGHRKNDPKDIVKGQTFIADQEGDLDAIEVFYNVVTDTGDAIMTLHNYDPVQKQWGSAIGSAKMHFDRSHAGKWMSFHIPGSHLTKGKGYGFRLESHDALIGMGEAAGSSANPPFRSGEEWEFTNNNNPVDTFSYFSLAFKVDLKD